MESKTLLVPTGSDSSLDKPDVESQCFNDEIVSSTVIIVIIIIIIIIIFQSPRCIRYSEGGQKNMNYRVSRLSTSHFHINIAEWLMAKQTALNCWISTEKC